MLSLFMPVHVKSLPKVKFIQILLKIVPNLTFKGHLQGQSSSSSKIMRRTERPYTVKLGYIEVQGT